jgi:OmpA-OmpF porin, OOP family
MKKALVMFLVLMMACVSSFSQTTDQVKQPSLGLHFLLNDFKTATAIRSSSLNSVIREKTNAKIKEMSPGLAITYMQGISSHVDFTTTLSGSFVDYPFQNGIVSNGADAFLLEADVALNAKLLPEQYLVNPFLTLGVGAFKYKGYYGAFMPAGAGLQINLFNEAFLLFNAQYRIRVTETSSYHFYYGIGFAGTLGSR